MLKYDLTQNPPTVEEITVERQEIDRRLAVFKRKAWIGSIALILAVAAVLVAYWPSGDDFAIAGAISGFFAGVFAGIVAGIVVVVVVVVVVGVSVVAFAGASIVTTAIAGAFLGAFFGAGVVVGVSVVAAVFVIGDRCDGYKEKRSSLDDIAPSDCGQLVADCLATPVCEDYRRKVAALGRKPVVAEAKMIREWVAEADGREKERCDDIAWGLVSSMESLSSDAVEKGDQKC